MDYKIEKYELNRQTKYILQCKNFNINYCIFKNKIEIYVTETINKRKYTSMPRYVNNYIGLMEFISFDGNEYLSEKQQQEYTIITNKFIKKLTIYFGL